jgi:hypothetical protein
MSVTHTVTRQYRDTSSSVISKADTVTGGTEKNLDLSVAVGTDIAQAFTLDRAILQSICLSATGALTIETNSAGTPTDTIVLTAGQVLVWSLAVDGLSKCPISANITSLFFTNGGAGTVTFQLRSMST